MGSSTRRARIELSRGRRVRRESPPLGLSREARQRVATGRRAREPTSSRRAWPPVTAGAARALRLRAPGAVPARDAGAGAPLPASQDGVAIAPIARGGGEPVREAGGEREQGERATKAGEGKTDDRSAAVKTKAGFEAERDDAGEEEPRREPLRARSRSEERKASSVASAERFDKKQRRCVFSLPRGSTTRGPPARALAPRPRVLSSALFLALTARSPPPSRRSPPWTFVRLDFRLRRGPGHDLRAWVCRTCCRDRTRSATNSPAVSTMNCHTSMSPNTGSRRLTASAGSGASACARPAATTPARTDGMPCARGAPQVGVDAGVGHPARAISTRRTTRRSSPRPSRARGRGAREPRRGRAASRTHHGGHCLCADARGGMWTARGEIRASSRVTLARARTNQMPGDPAEIHRRGRVTRRRRR